MPRPCFPEPPTLKEHMESRFGDLLDKEMERINAHVERVARELKEKGENQ